MRIAFITLMAGVQWGGSEELWYKTAILAKNNGHKVFASIYRWKEELPKIEYLKKIGIEINYRDRFDKDSSLPKKIKTFLKNRITKINNDYKKLFEFNPDIIFISQGSNFDLSVHHFELYKMIKTRNLKYFIVCHSHDQYSAIPDNNIYPRAIDIFVNAKNVFFVSNRMKQMTERILCCKLSNAIFTWNPLNITQYKYIKYPDNQTINFAIVAAIADMKGQDTALECLSHKNWSNRNWKLNIYGKGYGMEYIKQLAIFYGIQNNVILHGHVSNIEEIWLNNNILLIPSAGEGLPISLCEAMICGRAAIVTDVGGNTEMITDYITGYVAEAPTVNSFAKTLELAWKDKDNWEKMGLNAHNFAMKSIDLKAHETLLNILIN